ncbi:putative membrane protein [Propionispora sp. 2/2-37]|uniref:hypothetical protein n=1 Tax=Propionispora sp. 2/2-37 TaxID=1677858 RepID=UPI0006BB7CFE|nr:hypothetical protein [Propionispora sp. 2/2-37]CUH94116.1 putative membrane protein [Propionispora sp. 2/2-37]
MLLEILIILWMLIGLGCTLLPQVPGTLLIFTAMGAYILLNKPVIPDAFMWFMAGLVVIVEIGTRLYRGSLNSRCPLKLAVDTIVGNIAALVASNALVGMAAGTFFWQAMIGKTIMPRLDTYFQVWVNLLLVAFLRFLCGGLMIILAIKYLF